MSSPTRERTSGVTRSRRAPCVRCTVYQVRSSGDLDLDLDLDLYLRLDWSSPLRCFFPVESLENVPCSALLHCSSYLVPRSSTPTPTSMYMLAGFPAAATHRAAIYGIFTLDPAVWTGKEEASCPWQRAHNGTACVPSRRPCLVNWACKIGLEVHI